MWRVLLYIGAGEGEADGEGGGIGASDLKTDVVGFAIQLSGSASVVVAHAVGSAALYIHWQFRSELVVQ